MSELVLPSQPGFMPVDALGMPYGIVPAQRPGREFDSASSEHHGFYTRKHPALISGIGNALRLARTHNLPRWQHDDVHRQFPLGLDRFPDTDAAKFGLLVLSVAGYVAREGLVLDEDNQFVLRELTDHQYAEVRSRHHMHPQTNPNKKQHKFSRYPQRNTRYAYSFIGIETLRHIGSQDVQHLGKLQLAKDFLKTEDKGRRHRLGRILLREMTAVAVDPIAGEYAQAHRDGLIRVPESSALDLAEKRLLKGSWGKKESVLRSVLTEAVAKQG